MSHFVQVHDRDIHYMHEHWSTIDYSNHCWTAGGLAVGVVAAVHVLQTTQQGYENNILPTRTEKRKQVTLEFLVQSSFGEIR